MDAVEFLKEAKRMCTTCKECKFCPLDKTCIISTNLELASTRKMKEMVDKVKKWASEHPVKTRQSEFLKIFPNASQRAGVLDINPCAVDSKYKSSKGYSPSLCGIPCSDCKKEYWLAEVE